MNTKHLVIGALALSLVAGASLPVSYAFNAQGMMGGHGKQHHGMMDKMPGKNMEMSDAMKSLMTELRTAQKAGDTAKVTELRAKVKTQRDADMKAQQAAMDTAIAGGYDTWKAFATKQGMPAEMIAKITADNFSSFVELYNTKKKVAELEQKLGFPGMGMGGMSHMRGK